MRYRVLATDYDGTLAHDGVTDASTIAAMEQYRRAGGRLILVTGRELPDLERTFDRLDMFERVVAENGGLLYDPASGVERMLAPTFDPILPSVLRARGVQRVSVGRTIVATVEPYDAVVLDTIKELGLELQVIFNKGAVMVLPSGVNKGTGLAGALTELGELPQAVAGVGDAENDDAFLAICGLSVAVRNAIPALQQCVRLATVGARGQGVQELVHLLMRDGVT